MPPRPCLPPPGTLLHAVADAGHTVTFCGVNVTSEASRSSSLAAVSGRAPSTCPTCASDFQSRTGDPLRLS